MDAKGISAKIKFSAVNIETYVVGPVACNAAVNQTLFFIAEEAPKVAGVEQITVANYPEVGITRLAMDVKMTEDIYGPLNFVFEDDAIHTEDTEDHDTGKEPADLDIQGNPA